MEITGLFGTNTSEWIRACAFYLRRWLATGAQDQAQGTSLMPMVGTQPCDTSWMALQTCQPCLSLQSRRSVTITHQRPKEA